MTGIDRGKVCKIIHSLIEKNVVLNADEVIALFKETEDFSNELFSYLDDMIQE